MNNRILIHLLLLTLLFPLQGAELLTVTGIVTNNETGKPLPNTNVLLQGTGLGAGTDANGHFSIKCPAGSYRLLVQHIGYRVHSQSLIVKNTIAPLAISLRQTPIELSEIFTTATRTYTPVSDIPASVTVLSAESIQRHGGTNLDDLLAAEPGIDVYRNSGIYTVSPSVVLRGTGADEPGRTLVMVDGIPINKSDTGEANWNRLKAETLERVEIVRGPASALYGAGAMGGTINLITKKPEAGILIKTRLQGGNLGTAGGDISLSGGKILQGKGFFGFFLSGGYLNSNGYISDPPETRTPYTVKRFLHENSQTAKLVFFNGRHELQAAYHRYDDKRGEGEKILAPEGEFRNFYTDFITLQVKGSANRWNWQAKGYFQMEQYARIDERLQGETYQRFDVLSDRMDTGLLSSVSYRDKRMGVVTLGMDIRRGSVDGADTYRTSPNIVANRGTLTLLSGFIQDELSLFDRKLNIVTGLRLDQVYFHNGEISSTLAPWDTYNGTLKKHGWHAMSPRAGINYQLFENSRLYASLGRAFRGSILDDLCRSGWMRLGPKIANPELGPETLTNAELGFQQSLAAALFKLTGYYAVGRDFLYYVDTDLTVFGGRFTLKQRRNVARVKIYGIETSLTTPLGRYLHFSTGFTLNHSSIDRFSQMPDLQGKILTYSPGRKAKISVDFTAFIDGSVIWEWIDKQYTDNQNNETIAAFPLLHLNLSLPVVKGARAGLKIRNLLNEQYLLSEISLDPGRMVMGWLSYEY
ncbi:TonB-dependent receptor [candidate division KSB1 bacterium]|nr:TonB-dependent receptor [candidate division KSB1 bacterium]